MPRLNMLAFDKVVWFGKFVNRATHIDRPVSYE